MNTKLTTLFLLLLFSFSLHSQGFDIEEYNVDVTVSRDGYFDVEEKLRVNFTERKRGIIKNIPYKYKVDGKKYKLSISKIEVENWKYSDFKQNNDVVIRIGDKDKYITGDQVYTIKYRVENAILKYDEYTEFYWDLIGSSWQAKIEKVNFNITFPSNADLSTEDVKVFAGKEGNDQSYIDFTIGENRISGSSDYGLFSGEGLTVAVKLDPELIQLKTQSRQTNTNTIRKEKPSDYTFPIPIIFGIVIFGFWRIRGRNKKNNSEIIEQYKAPEDISSAEVGAFYDNSVDTRDIISLIAEWGRKDYIRVRSVGVEYGYESDDLLIEKTDILRNGEPEYQKYMFAEMFKEGDSILLSSLKNKFYTSFHKVKSMLKREVKKFSLYDEYSYNVFHSGWFIGLFFLCVAAGVVSLIFGYILTATAMLPLSIFCIGIHFLPPKRSESGMILKDYLDGFKLFLENPGEEKLSELVGEDPDYFEKILPFAIALGVDKKLTDKFNNFHKIAPSWYYMGVGTTHSQINSFSNFSSTFNVETVTSAFTSSPASSHTGSSSSSTFSGGGSVGGGFGGGGGGSW